MNPSLLIAFRAVWLTIIGLEAALCVLLIARRAYKAYPAFCIFIWFSTARSMLLLGMNFWHSAQFEAVRWMIYIPQLLILMALVIEVLHQLFHPYEALPKNTMGHFAGATAMIAVFAIAFAVTHPGAQPTAWARFTLAVDQTVSWILCAVFMLVALFSSYFGIPWRHRLYGIGAGFLVYLCADVAVTTAITQMGVRPLSILRLIDMMAFLASCLIWGYYFLAKETARCAPTNKEVEEVRTLVAGFSRLLPDKER